MNEISKNKKKTLILLIIGLLFLFAAGQRIFLLYTSQHYLDGDEAWVGLMAKHILEQGEHPLFWYGIHYNGGGSVEAHLGALAFVIGGYSDVSLKFVALFVSLLIFVFLYIWSKENYGDTIALISVFLYVFSVSFIQWNLKLRGHLTGMLWMIILLWSISSRTNIVPNMNEVLYGMTLKLE